MKTSFKELRTICIKCYNKLAARLARQRALDCLGSKCTRCGFSDPRALQIDHVNGGGSESRRKSGPLTTYRQVPKNPSLFQILCANCNWIKRAEDQERAASCHHDVEYGFTHFPTPRNT